MAKNDKATSAVHTPVVWLGPGIKQHRTPDGTLVVFGVGDPIEGTSMDEAYVQRLIADGAAKAITRNRAGGIDGAPAPELTAEEIAAAEAEAQANAGQVGAVLDITKRNPDDPNKLEPAAKAELVTDPLANEAATKTEPVLEPLS